MCYKDMYMCSSSCQFKGGETYTKQEESDNHLVHLMLDKELTTNFQVGYGLGIRLSRVVIPDPGLATSTRNNAT